MNIVLHPNNKDIHPNEKEMKKMGSVSFDASLKVKSGDVSGYVKHISRREGDGVNHGNEKINPELTKYNLNFNFNNPKTGRLYTISERLEEVKRKFEVSRLVYNNSNYKATGGRMRRPLNDNSVLIRGLVFAPPKEAFDGCGDDMKAKQEVMSKFVKDVFEWYGEEFEGYDTFLGAEVHMDETSPHVHIAMAPLTKDNRIAQKEYFKSPATLKQMHKTLRDHLNTKGWNVDKENKYVDAKHYNDAEYKAHADEIENARGVKKGRYKKRMQELEELQESLKAESERLLERERRVLEREKKVRAVFESIKIREQQLAKKIEVAKRKYPSLRNDNDLQR